jgi:hypothetical protein
MATLTDEELASQARRDKARSYFDRATSSDPAILPITKREAWADLWRFKKTCKKSWEALGFTSREIERAKTNKPDWI